jgi:hypothetical protein
MHFRRFKRKLPPYACKYIEMCLMMTADHGPAVCGAHNTIVTGMKEEKCMHFSCWLGRISTESVVHHVIFIFCSCKHSFSRITDIIASHHITSHHIASHHITSHHITARAGKDLVSSLVSGLLTIVCVCVFTSFHSFSLHSSSFIISDFLCDSSLHCLPPYTHVIMQWYVWQGDRFGGALDEAARMFTSGANSTSSFVHSLIHYRCSYK